MPPCEGSETCALISDAVCENLKKDVFIDQTLPWKVLEENYKCGGQLDGEEKYCCTNNGQHLKQGSCDWKTSSFLNFSIAKGARNCLISCENTQGISIKFQISSSNKPLSF